MPKPYAVRKEDVEKALTDARAFWGDVAKKNGWSRPGVLRVQVWARIVDGRFVVTDSLYAPEKATLDVIIFEGRRAHLTFPDMPSVVFQR